MTWDRTYGLLVIVSLRAERVIVDWTDFDDVYVLDTVLVRKGTLSILLTTTN